MRLCAASHFTAAFLTAFRVSTDDFLGAQANSSNLALKGIIAIKAMSEIRAALNMSDSNPSYSVCLDCVAKLAFSQYPSGYCRELHQPMVDPRDPERRKGHTIDLQ